MTFKKFIHAGVILVTVANVSQAWGMERAELNEHLAEAAEIAISYKAANDPLVAELAMVADRKGPYGTFCLFLSTRAQLAILPFLTFDDLLALIELEYSDLKAFRKKEAMNPQSEESLRRDLTRVQAISLYAIDQIETREQWRQATNLFLRLGALLREIGRRQVHHLRTFPTEDQRNAEDLIAIGQSYSLPQFILLGMAVRGLSNDQPTNSRSSVNLYATHALQSHIRSIMPTLTARLNFIGETLEITRMDRLRAGVSSLCERLLF